VGRLLAAATVLALMSGGCTMMNEPDDQETPPEREFDQSTAWEQLETATAETVAGLPEFPGFARRLLSKNACSHEGETDSDYVNLELTYEFSEDLLNDPLLRETYPEALLTQWKAAGYEITREKVWGDQDENTDYEALRPDGIRYWWTAAGKVGLRVQSGCVKKVDGWPLTCPAPLGGVSSENDVAWQEHCETDVETSETTEAIAPFAEIPAVATVGLIPWQTPRTADRSKTDAESANPFEDLL
jgi:hypothetical protein